MPDDLILGPLDSPTLNARLGIDWAKRAIVIDLGKSVNFLVMDADSAERLALQILGKVKRLRNPGISI